MAVDIGEGMWVEKGVAKGRVSTAEELAACRHILTTHYIPEGTSSLPRSIGNFNMFLKGQSHEKVGELRVWGIS
jgi:hypothetical protein